MPTDDRPVAPAPTAAASLRRTGTAVSLTLQHGPLAQLAEQRTFNPRVPGSIPGRPTQVRRFDRQIERRVVRFVV